TLASARTPRAHTSRTRRCSRPATRYTVLQSLAQHPREPAAELGRSARGEDAVERLIVRLIARPIGRWFFRTVRRWPAVFAAVALVGECVGGWAVGFWSESDWVLVGIGVLCLVFYTGLLV